MGNTATATEVTVFVDSVAPIVTLGGAPCDGTCGDGNDEDAETAGLQVTIDVTATQVENGRVISLSSTTGGERCTGQTNGGQVALTCTLLEGADQSLTATVSDASGNSTTSAAATVSVELDRTQPDLHTPAANPELPLNAQDDADGGTPGMQYSFVLSCDAIGQPVTLTVGGQAIQQNCVGDPGSATFTNVGPLRRQPNGHGSGSDAQGNNAQVQITVNVDTQAPTIEITSPAANPATYVYADDRVHEDNVNDLMLDTNLVVAVNGAAGGTVTVTSDQDDMVQTKAVDGDTDNVITDVRLSNQNHSLTLVATDANGNEASATLVANVDVGKPGTFSLSTQVQSNRAGTVQVTWTEPGDDFATGTVASYVLRYSTNQITEANFAYAATDSGATMTPQQAGRTMTVDLSQLPLIRPSIWQRKPPTMRAISAIW